MTEFFESRPTSWLPSQDKRPYCFCNGSTYDPKDAVCTVCGFNKFCAGKLVEGAN